MAKTSKGGDLEIEQDLDFQEKEWTVERIGWALLFLLIVVALIGVFGSGPASETSKGGQDEPLRVEYERFWRKGAPFALRVHPNPDAVENGEVVLWFENDYLEKFRIETIIPEPNTVEIGQDRYLYHFTVSPQAVPDEITFYIQPEVAGPVNGSIGNGQEAGFELSHYIFP